MGLRIGASVAWFACVLRSGCGGPLRYPWWRERGRRRERDGVVGVEIGIYLWVVEGREVLGSMGQMTAWNRVNSGHS